MHQMKANFLQSMVLYPIIITSHQGIFDLSHAYLCSDSDPKFMYNEILLHLSQNAFCHTS